MSASYGRGTELKGWLNKKGDGSGLAARYKKRWFYMQGKNQLHYSKKPDGA